MTIDTSVIQARLDVWRVQIIQQTVFERRKTKERLNLLVAQAGTRTEIFDNAANRLDPSDHEFKLVALSLHILFSSLTMMLEDLFRNLRVPVGPGGAVDRFWTLSEMDYCPWNFG